MGRGLKAYALRGAELGIVETMELALIMSADDPDGAHPEWARNELARCIEGDWAPKPCIHDPSRAFVKVTR